MDDAKGLKLEMPDNFAGVIIDLVMNIYFHDSLDLPLLETCERGGRQFPACLQHLCFGSAPVYRSFLERLIPVLPAHVRLSCLYGMTENLLTASIDGREKARLGTEAGDIVGKPVPGVEIDIAPDGEVLVRSPQTFARYLHLDRRDDWHATGDLGHLDPVHGLVLTGRHRPGSAPRPDYFGKASPQRAATQGG